MTSTSWYDERRADRAAERQADREDRTTERAEARKDAEAERRRKAADRREREERQAKARAARAAKVGKITGWVTADPARAFVRLVQACSIVPAVVSQIGALTGAGVEPLLAGLLAAMLEGAAWALVAMGSRAEGERSTRTYRIGAWAAGAVAAWINYSHGAQQYAAHSWVAIVLALSSLVAVWLTDLQTHGGKGPTKVEKQMAKDRKAHASRRAADHPEVLKVAQRLLSATPHGALHPDDAWRVAWSYVEGVGVTGVTADLIAGQLAAKARVTEVSEPRPAAPDWGPDMPPDPFLDDPDSVYEPLFPEALEAASRRSSDSPESLDGKGLQGVTSAPKKAAAEQLRDASGNNPQAADGRPLAPEDLAQVRALADLLASTDQALSVKKIRELIHCRSDYAMRLRNQVQAERSGRDDDGGEPAVTR
ncbi:heme exporter protein D [Kitasatospora sp. GP30]|uniref:DUF2637 domain-containing protein n=1 Tax=Kitasatospora sp. GP30 TaxID=3035084 RepID=UPI000C7127EE|nr:DUF2637 domain-containing protein [Kitasatospora sp. GP30]MDH6141048.1 heme exporter protein D [Kitasatospora sp. GP30]